MPDTVTIFQSHNPHGTSPVRHEIRRISVRSLGMSLGVFFSLTFTLCVLFDLWLPAYAMNTAWTPLLPGFVWISWTSFVIGLAETFAYGWYIALVFAPLYNFFAARTNAA